MRNVITLVLIGTLSLAGCASTANNTQKGAGIGAIVGAILGKATGDHDKSRYVWGAAVGAIAGAAVGSYMDEQEEQLREELADSGVQVYREGDTIRLAMPGNITFATDSNRVDANFYPVLVDVAKVLNNYPKTTLQIIGHTDDVGTPEYNQRLSEQRASSVRGFLVSQNVDSRRITTTGMGEYQPIVNNTSAENRAQNRRVELEIMPLTTTH